MNVKTEDKLFSVYTDNMTLLFSVDANLVGANLDGANLNHANLVGANRDGASLRVD